MEVFDLIQKMDAKEKGYFKSYVANQGGSKNYIQLFEVLCKIKVYDRKEIQGRLPGKAFSTNLHVTQNYLQKMIMKSLRLYREEGHIDMKLQNLRFDAKIYEEKGLSTSIDKALIKAKKLAETHHKYLVVYEILETQARHLVARNDKNVLQDVKAIYEEMKEVLEIMEEERTFKQLNHQVLLCFRAVRRNAQKKYAVLLRSIANHPFLDINHKPRSFNSQYLQYNIRCTQARIIGDRFIAHESYLKILVIWESHEAILKANLNRYKIHIHNFLSNAITSKFFDQVEVYLQKLEAFPSDGLTEKVETFQNVVSLRLLFFLNQSLLTEGKAYVVRIEEQLVEYKETLIPSSAIVIYHNILMLNFLLADYDGAQDWVNKILGFGPNAPRQDICSFARIFQLIIYYELDQDSLLDSRFKAINRKVKLEEKLSENERQYEIQWLKLINSLIKAKNKAEKRNLLNDFYTDLKTKSGPKTEFMSINELSIWLEARIKNEPVQKVYERKLLA